MLIFRKSIKIPVVIKVFETFTYHKGEIMVFLKRGGGKDEKGYFTAAVPFDVLFVVRNSERANHSDSFVQPYYEMANTANSKLTVIGTTAVCESTLRGDTNVVKITAEQYLQKQGFLWIWSTYDGAEWTKTVYSNVLAMSNTKTGLSSGKYRLKTIFTLTDKNGKVETVTVYSEKKKI